MRICISGLTGSGKTTIGNHLAKNLNIEHITKVMTESSRLFVKDAKLTADQKLIEYANVKYANGFDAEIAKMAEKAKNSVVSTWLGPWIVKNPTVRVWLYTDLKDRIERTAKRHGLSTLEAERYIEKKDSMTIGSFKKIYNINIMDNSNFDLQINTSKLGINETVSIISMVALLKERNNW